MKRRATALLGAVAVAFVVLALVGDPDGAVVGYALAAAEGGLVGGLADWFAVTALFRRPLGLPIPHTAIIRERKDQFGETLGGFVQENFLTPEVVTERVRAAQIGHGGAAWLAAPYPAATASRAVLDAVVAGLDLVGDDDVHRLLHGEVERALRSVPAAALAGRALRTALEEGRHRAAVDAVLRGAQSYLEEQREPLRERFSRASPWWLPGAVEDRLYDRIVDGARLLLGSVLADPGHDLRRQLDDRLRSFADRLEHDPELAARAEDLLREVVASPDVRAWTRTLWSDLRLALREREDLAGRLARAIATVGGRLAGDEVLQRRLEDAAETAVRHVVTHHRDELSSLISATIARWDGQETSDKLELLLGRDLQFIRVNGTVVGALAGVAIHGLADLLR